MKIGLALGTPYERLEDFEVELDIARESRLDSLWIPDHLWGVFHPELWSRMSYGDRACSPDAWMDPPVLAGALSQRIDLPWGTGVVDATRRRAPDMLRAALSVHHLAPGGFMLGVGSGEAENIVPFGYPFDRPVGKLEEFLIEARLLLDHGTMPGDLHGTLGLPAAAPGKGKMPIWVAAYGPRALRLAGSYGDGWISVFVDPDTFNRQREIVTQHAADAGRPAPPARCWLIAVMGDSRDEVAERLEAEPLAKLITMLAPAELWEAFGLAKPGAGGAGYRDVLIHDLAADELARIAPAIPIEMVEASGVCIGSAAEIAERLAPYRDAGVDRLTIANFSGFVGGLPRVAAMKDQFVELTHLLAEEPVAVAPI